MPLKVSVTLECAECGEEVLLKGETFTQYSRRRGVYSGILLPDVYIVNEPDGYNGFTRMAVSRSFRYLGKGDFPEDNAGLVCGIDCAIKRMNKIVRKLKPEVIEKES